MALITNAIRGTQDVLPGESYKWQHVEQTALAIARDFGYREMRVPVFEHTELFQRVGGRNHRRGAEGNVHLRRIRRGVPLRCARRARPAWRAPFSSMG